MRKIQRAIISVTDKEGIAEFSKELSKMGVEIISTGGTAELLKKEGLSVIPISSFTGLPEMLGGRVKTLHPKIHGGILAIRDNDEHMRQMTDYGLLPIDMVVVNLYAFEQTIKSGRSFEDAIENIDIGGPAMIRAAAKNFRCVACIVDPSDYPSIIEEMKSNGAKLSMNTRFGLAKKVFALTARYDGAISNYLGGFPKGPSEKTNGLPDSFSSQFRKIQDLRYGENPHQRAAFYSNIPLCKGTLAAARQLQGKELSFNNILDLNAAFGLLREFHEPSCVIIKHNNPCGAAMSKEGLNKAYELALSCDPKSAFGGIVGFNGSVTKELAVKIGDIFLEAIIAPFFEKDSLEVLGKKKNLRIIEVGELAKEDALGYEMKMVSGGVLIQILDTESASDLKCVTRKSPAEEELTDMLFAWNVCKHVKSNAIIFAREGRTLGIGAGQMSRIDSTRIAVMKAQDVGFDLKGSVMGSDAFFPFRDNVDMAAEAGVSAIIQPGGSIRDEEVIKAADEHDMAMVFTGIRHFKH